MQDAERAGVAIIHQELDLVPELTAADNIFLGREPLIAGTIVDRRRIAKAAHRLLARLGIEIDPQSRVAELRVGEQQLVEIAKALSLDARILMMDEPTSALSTSECDTLFKVVRQLAAAGVAIIFTSHRIDEVVALADRVTVLRDGRHVLTSPIENLSEGAIISAMVGRNIVLTNRAYVATESAPVLSVRNLTLDTVSQRGWRRVLQGVNFDLRRGEILGIGGLLGSGRTEILESIFGAARGWRGGEIAIDGEPAAINSPAEACRLGVALVTEDRKARGLLLSSTHTRQCRPSFGRFAVPLRPALLRARSRRSLPTWSKDCPFAATTSSRSSRPCRAATSRRSSSANGWRRSLGSCCSTSRPAASTWGRSRRSISSSSSSRRTGWAS